MIGANDYDIFISYTREDVDVAKRLAEQLAGHGWSVFWDRVLLPGATWRTQIQSALNASRVVVVLWSSNSIDSRWVEIEADHAFQRDVYLPVKIDDCALPLGLSHVQVGDLRRWHHDRGGGHTLPDVLIQALKHRLRETMADRPTEQAVVRPMRLRPAADKKRSTVLAVDFALRLAGKARSGEQYELTVHLSQLNAKPEGLVLGRVASHCDLLVPHGSVSRRHALLRVGEGKILLSDLGSTNGTQVDAKPATTDQAVQLTRGSVVRLGDVELVVVGISH